VPTCDDNGVVNIAGVRVPTAIGVGLLGLESVVETLVRGTVSGAVGLAVLVCLLGLATTVPLALPQATTAAMAVVACDVVSLSVFHVLTVAGTAAALVGAYRLGYRGLPAAAVAVGLPYLPVALTATRHPEVRVGAFLLAALTPVAALASTARRIRHERDAHQDARRRAEGTLLEHTARTERARIARELHDVVAHHISMVAVQAETARLTTPGMPAVGATRLSAIGDTARSALTEMRRLLGVLREDAEAPQRLPQPGLRELADLLDEARDATGAGTRLILCGPPVPLDPGVELAAYRIVQEALTNARRHAPGAAVDVELDFTDGAALKLLVRDNGPGPATAPQSGGHGLLGMRERAGAVGGRLRAGPATPGGFLVEAILPTRAADVP